MRSIALPQALRTIIPATTNDYASLGQGFITGDCHRLCRHGVNRWDHDWTKWPGDRSYCHLDGCLPDDQPDHFPGDEFCQFKVPDR